jgi:carboxyl-terminal processing protease
LHVLEFAAKTSGQKKIGYIRIAQFTPNVAAAVKDAITSLEASGVTGYVLDLRNNPGGFLNAAREVAGFFASGTLGYKRTSDNKHEPITAMGTPLTSKPLAILINGGTASASELVSSSLQGLQRARLVGVHSYGRARAQIFSPLPDDYGVQIPAVEVLTPAQKEFKGKGIFPDVEISQPWLPEKELAGPRDKQFQRAVAELGKGESK